MRSIMWPAARPLRKACRSPPVGADDGWIGPYRVINTSRYATSSVPNRHRPALILGVRSHYDRPVEGPDWSATDTSAYHGGMLEDEVAALLSLLLGIRLKARGATRVDGAPVAWSGKVDPLVRDGSEDLAT